VTGGVDGVGATFARAFAEARRAASLPENLFHLLPRGFGPCDTGVTLTAGDDMSERREVIGCVGRVYLVIEGGPGTVHEAEVAADHGFPVIPVARTGGHAAALHSQTHPPTADWNVLADANAPHPWVVAAVGRLVRSALGAVIDCGGCVVLG
ncbi:MAG TPA: hypothetical protein VM597_01920, partial [Gemmataceae bacterium]|nr:hypothetical protein [Gemmataceae bacterium]